MEIIYYNLNDVGIWRISLKTGELNYRFEIGKDGDNSTLPLPLVRPARIYSQNVTWNEQIRLTKHINSIAYF